MRSINCQGYEFVKTIASAVVDILDNKAVDKHIEELSNKYSVILNNDSLALCPINYDSAKIGFFMNFVLIKEIDSLKKRKIIKNFCSLEIALPFVNAIEPPKAKSNTQIKTVLLSALVSLNNKSFVATHSVDITSDLNSKEVVNKVSNFIVIGFSNLIGCFIVPEEISKFK